MKWLLFALLVVLLTQAHALELTIDELSYDQGDQVYFQACGENELSIYVSCLGIDKLHQTDWGNGCHLFAFDTNDLTCAKVRIAVDDDTEEVEETILVNNYAAVLQSTERESDDPVVVALHAYAADLLNDMETKNALLDELKMQRDDTGKCWPADSCSIRVTTEVAHYLSLADVNRSRRVYDDALLWIESQQNRVIDGDWEIRVTGEETTACTGTQGGASIGSFAFDETEEHFIDISYSSDSSVNMTCDDNFCVEITDDFDHLVYEDCGDEDANVTFRMHGSCWGATKWGVCDALVTTRAMQLKDLDEDAYDEGLSWIDEHIVFDAAGGSRLKESQDLLPNMYTYNITNDEDVLTWILHAQNNDGSFGRVTERKQTTLEAIRILRGVGADEWVRDATAWVSLMRPEAGWESVLLDVLTYEAFRSDRPVIRTDPLIIDVDGPSARFSVTSTPGAAVIHNLSSGLNDIVLVNVPAYVENSEIVAQTSTAKDGTYYGFLHLVNDSYQRDIPLVVKKRPTMAVHPEPAYYVFNETGTLSMRVAKSSSLQSCAFNFNHIVENVARDILDANTIKFSYNARKSGEYIVEGNFTCVSELATITDVFTFAVKRFSGTPFSLSAPDEEILEPALLFIQNELNEEINVTLVWQNDASAYPVPELVTIGARDEVQVPLYQAEAIEGNRTEENSLRVAAYGYVERVPISIFLDETSEGPPKEGLPWLWIFLSIVAFVALALVVLLRKNAPKPTPPPEEPKEEKKPKKKRKRKSKPPKSMTDVLVAVHRSMGKSEKAIEKALKGKGHTKAEITRALKELHKIDEDRKKKKEAEAPEEEVAEDTKEA